MRVCNGHGHGLHVCVRAMCELRLCGGAAACVWRNVVAPIAFHTRSMSIRHVPPRCARVSMPWRLKALPPSILRLHAPRRAPSSPESSPWSAGRAPRPPATAWRLLGGLLCRGSADAPAPYAAERSRSRCAPQATRGRRAATRACTGMQALHGASATRCGSGGCRCGGATHAAVDQRERALKLSAADGGQQRVCAAGRRGSGQHLAHCFRARAKVPKSAVKVSGRPSLEIEPKRCMCHHASLRLG